MVTTVTTVTTFRGLSWAMGLLSAHSRLHRSRRTRNEHRPGVPPVARRGCRYRVSGQGSVLLRLVHARKRRRDRTGSVSVGLHAVARCPEAQGQQTDRPSQAAAVRKSGQTTRAWPSSRSEGLGISAHWTFHEAELDGRTHRRPRQRNRQDQRSLLVAEGRRRSKRQFLDCQLAETERKFKSYAFAGISARR
jgi:hypothetical protein